jgi:hypothetical protein
VSRITRIPLALAVLAVAGLASLGAAATASAASAPSIESESVSDVTATDATLEAQLNPNGLETTYRFHLEYGCGIAPDEACPMYCVVGQPCPTDGLREVPLPADELAASSEPEAVALHLNAIGVTLKPATKYRYSLEATNSEGTSKGAAQFFTTPTPPTIESESASQISATDATLEAQINPQGAQHGAIYQFQLVANPSEFRPRFTCPNEGFPAHSSLCLPLESQAGALPIGWTASSTEIQSVSVDLASVGTTLDPGTTYHYRLIAANSVQTVDTIAWEEPIVSGPDQTFITPSAPTIESASVSNISATDATLEAQINPNGLETEYQFRLEFGCGVPEPGGAACLWIAVINVASAELPASFEAQSVRVDLNNSAVALHPDTRYRYSVEATNSAGRTPGRDQTFTTPPESTAEPLAEPSGNTNTQRSTTTRSPSPTSPSHRKKHRRRHRSKLHRAKRAAR